MRTDYWATLMLSILVSSGPWCDTRPATAEELHLKAMTFNIRYGSANDGENAWAKRREMVVKVIQDYAADFVGLQEAELGQIKELRQDLPAYTIVARSRLVDENQGEAVPLMYRHERWQPDPQQQGTFWLCDTPEKPGSTTWGNLIPRIVTWGRFTEKKTGRALYVFNTHFDHLSDASRCRSALLLARRIAERKTADPVILTGDFNADESSLPIRYLTGLCNETPCKLVDTFRLKCPEEKTVGTFHAFRGTQHGGKIDYVFALPGVKVLQARIVHDNCEGRYPSDHYPVSAEIVLPQSHQQKPFCSAGS